MLAYLNLTKPRISLLFAFTGFTAMVMEGSFASWSTVGLITLAIFLVGGGANALNQYFERDIDKEMQRTAERRSLPRGLMTPREALLFSIVLSITGIFILSRWGEPLACLLGVATIVYYSFFYTLYLKPRTPYNIVIGGAGGATGPLIGWAAMAGTLEWTPIILFLLIFMWTPPHFWALALYCKSDYEKVSLPMLPNVKGEAATRRQILYYSVTILPLSLSLCVMGSAGWIYGGGATLLGLGFLWGAIQAYREKTEKVYKGFFFYSILYLMLIFVALTVDALI
jgi:heme o synthase